MTKILNVLSLVIYAFSCSFSSSAISVYLVTFHSSLLHKFDFFGFKIINVSLCSFLPCSSFCFLCSRLSLTFKCILVVSIRPVYIGLLQHGFGDVHCSHTTTCFDRIIYSSLSHQRIFLQILHDAVTVY